MSDDYFNPIASEPESKRQVDSTTETPAEGGGYSFMFYGPRRGGKPPKKKNPPDFGVPVEVQLSDEARARLEKENAESQVATEAPQVKPASPPPALPQEKPVLPNPEDKGTQALPGGHLDITV
ncbi:MAG: hypothetical protein A2X49_07200 [Lentisphaerae bacterium GWF2_52_8]|nr:MAG: hypothetical protein A2X49_07200 [Lentisphaerae bacterium GWF2_52_8]